MLQCTNELPLCKSVCSIIGQDSLSTGHRIHTPLGGKHEPDSVLQELAPLQRNRSCAEPPEHPRTQGSRHQPRRHSFGGPRRSLIREHSSRADVWRWKQRLLLQTRRTLVRRVLFLRPPLAHHVALHTIKAAAAPSTQAACRPYL